MKGNHDVRCQSAPPLLITQSVISKSCFVLFFKPFKKGLLYSSSFFLSFFLPFFLSLSLSLSLSLFLSFLAVLGLCCCTWALVVAVCGLSISGSRALEHRLSSGGAQTQLLHSMWDLPRLGLEPVSPALAGRFSTTAPSGKSQEGTSLMLPKY